MAPESRRTSARRALPPIWACVATLGITAAVFLARPKRDFSDLDFTNGNLPSDVRSIDWRALRRGWNGSWAGQPVRVPGFILPLEDDAGDVTEFLLVPYSRGCIHTPTPPQNQIVHVHLAGDGRARPDTQRPIWVYGALQPQPDGAYHMLSTKITPYEGRP